MESYNLLDKSSNENIEEVREYAKARNELTVLEARVKYLEELDAYPDFVIEYHDDRNNDLISLKLGQARALHEALGKAIQIKLEDNFNEYVSK